jgi:hypothetical protein
MTGGVGVSAVTRYHRRRSTTVLRGVCRSTARSILNAVPLRECEPGCCGREVSKTRSTTFGRAGRCEPSQRSASTQLHCPDSFDNPLLKLVHLQHDSCLKRRFLNARKSPEKQRDPHSRVHSGCCDTDPSGQKNQESPLYIRHHHSFQLIRPLFVHFNLKSDLS